MTVDLGQILQMLQWCIMGNRRQRRVALGKPLPPADEIEFSAETMRQWNYNQGKVHADKYGTDDFRAELDAQLTEDETA